MCYPKIKKQMWGLNVGSYQVDVAETLQSFDEMSEKLLHVRIGCRFGDAAVHHQSARLESGIIPDEKDQKLFIILD